MPAISISHGLLQRNPANLRALRVSGVLWSDWGSPNRVRQTLERIGRLYELASRLAERGYKPEAVLGETGDRSLANVRVAKNFLRENSLKSEYFDRQSSRSEEQRRS